LAAELVLQLHQKYTNLILMENQKAKIEIIEDPNLIEKAKDAEAACPTPFS